MTAMTITWPNGVPALNCSSLLNAGLRPCLTLSGVLVNRTVAVSDNLWLAAADRGPTSEPHRLVGLVNDSTAGGAIVGEDDASRSVASAEEGTELPFYIRVNVTIFCVAILVIGVFGNLLVPLVVWRNRDMRNSTNLFLVNLSISDVLVLVVCMPTVLVEIHSRPEVWVMGEIMCKVVPFVELTVAHGSALTILAISFERYYAICKPLKAGYKLTRARALVIIVCLWVFATLVTSPVAVITKYDQADHSDGTRVPVCRTGALGAWEQVYHLVITLVFFGLPLLILVVIYTVIVRHLMATPTIMGTKLDTANMRARRQVVVMVGTVVVFFFVCLLPFRVFVFWVVLVPDVHALTAESFYNLLYFCRIMCYINSAINPILYNLTSTKFRQAFMRALGLRKSDKRHRLDRQTTFNTTYTSLYSSLKVRAVERSVNGHVVARQNSAHDSAV